jgi:simple sugar transport system ATP-binding protein
MKGITKRFPGVTANDSIDFDLRAHEVHALLGENGAGKTTLMNVLYGIHRPDEGEIWAWGRRVGLRSPKDAIKLGIGMVQQHFALVPTMTVSENVVLGLRSEKEPLLELPKVEERISGLSQTFNIAVDPRARIEELSVGERQRVKIIKDLYREVKVLILDEPTSVLTPHETEELFKVLRSMVGGGLSVVFITHKLREVAEVSDRITVLRQGKVVAKLQTRLTNPTDLAGKMVGKDIPPTTEGKHLQKGEILLDLRKLTAVDDKGFPALRDVSLSLHRAEILGLAGVAGNGQKELAEVLTGMRKAKDGKVRLLGEDVTNFSPGALIKLGVGHIPEDRIGSGLIMDFSIAENLILEVRSNPPFAYRWFLPFHKNYFLNSDDIHKHAENLVQEYGIVAPSVDSPARNLSGGNLQRLILAKVLSRSPKLIVAEQPAAGLDVAATEFIWQKLREEKRNGAGILLISGDLNEVISLSDRIAVMYNGEIVGIVSAPEADVKGLGLMMGGVKTTMDGSSTHRV